MENERIDKAREGSSFFSLESDYLREFLTLDPSRSLKEVPEGTPLLPQSKQEKLHFQSRPHTVEKVNPKHIYFFEGDARGFEWRHHNRTKSDYQQLVKSFEEVERECANGKTLEKLIEDRPELTSAIQAGFNGKDLPRVCRWKDAYIFDSDGRHRIMMAQELGVEKLNVRVIGEFKDNE